MNLSAPLLETDLNQARASDPGASAWVSANAGTGKTHVLVMRVLRLLLSGARPEAILCLTYTKTAAAEMQNRLLKVLGVWATQPANELEPELAKLIGRPPDGQDLRNARRLFARVLEAKGGLKIYTIHGFCERLLQRFPLEAEVTPNFTVLEDSDQAALRSSAIDAVIARAARDKHGFIGRSLLQLIAATSEFWFRKVIAAMLEKRAALARIMAYHGAIDGWHEREALALKQALSVERAVEEELLAEMASVLSDADIDLVLSAFVMHGGDKKTDIDAEASLRAAQASTVENRVAAFRSIFLTGDGNPKKTICTAAIRNRVPDICSVLDAAQSRFAKLDATLAHLRVAEASGAALALADAIRAEYEQRKRAEAALDYDDLIVKSLNLLSRSNAASWVLFKIDGGVDHILVDEAQDTNPEQWLIVQYLAEEFFAGTGASERTRTLFAVGDEKQSIYSFQGANPARFGEIGRLFRSKAAAISQDFHAVPLTLSFRSVPVILEAVDRVFARPDASAGLSFTGGEIVHHARRQGEPGIVELWDIEREEKRKPVDAFEPWAEEAAGARAVDALARRIAEQIRHWIDTREYLPSQKRVLRAGDILILVRRREPFIAPMIRALKREGVSVAGADRMKLMDQLAVQDLIALADFLLLQEDDLALAVVLKSPLFGFDDDDLFRLAHGRKGRLWRALRDKAEEDARFAEAHARLKRWLSRADLVPPYEFFAEILGENDQSMRKSMLVRLGPEAADAIDEFLDIALNYDRDAAPSLQGFVNRLRTDEAEIKRDMEQDRDEVRIMTVHGAKGLQAPIVFLPDTCMGPRPQGPRLFDLPRAGEPPDEIGHIIWPPPGHSDVEAIQAAKQESDRANRDEYNRLLYVAMTRACDRLYVAGWTGQKNPEEKCWYSLIKEGLDGYLTETADFKGRQVWRLETPPSGVDSVAAPDVPKPAKQKLPAWTREPVKPERGRIKLTPSRIMLDDEGRAKPGADQPPLGPHALAKDDRFARGRLVHALLQHLPEIAPEAQERAARAFVAAKGMSLDDGLKQEIVLESLAIVRDPSFAPLFRPGSLAEVPVVARIGEGDSAFDLEGQIDRLAILQDEILILDYKTNRPPPTELDKVAPAYIAQLAAYRAALSRLFPGRPLRAALLWTDGPRLMEIPSNRLDQAEHSLLRQGRHLDASGLGS